MSKARQGHTFVLEGPPGTGKSQTIANLLARAIADGQQVLFVAEKRAALDVVKERMGEVGLGPFCLDLHDKGSKPAVVRQQLLTALNTTTDPDIQGFGVDSAALHRSSGALAAYTRVLHEPNPTGLSYYLSRDLLLTLGEGPSLPIEPDFLATCTPDVSRAVETSLRELPAVSTGQQLSRQAPWAMLEEADFSTVARTDLAESIAGLDLVAAKVAEDGSPVGLVLRTAPTSEDLLRLSALLGTDLPDLTTLSVHADDRWGRYIAGVLSEIRAFPQANQHLLSGLSQQAIDLPIEQIGQQTAAAVQSGFFGRKKRLSAVIDHLRPGLAPETDVHPKAVPELVDRIAALHASAAALRERVAQIPGLTVAPTWNPLDPEQVLAVEASLVTLASHAAFVTGAPGAWGDQLRGHFRTPAVADPRGAGLAASLSSTWSSVLERLPTSEESVSTWRDGRALYEAISASLPTWVADSGNARFLQLQRRLELVNCATALRSPGLQEARPGDGR